MKFWAEIFCILVVAYLYVQIRNARRQSGRGNSNSRGSSNDDAGGLPLVGSSDDGASHHGSGHADCSASGDSGGGGDCGGDGGGGDGGGGGD